MKNLYLMLVLSLVFLLAWCWKSEINIQELDFDYDVEVCDKFFEVSECIINNTKNSSWTQEKKDNLRNGIIQKQEQWKALTKEQLEEECSSILSTLKEASDLDELWCQI